MPIDAIDIIKAKALSLATQFRSPADPEEWPGNCISVVVKKDVASF